MKIAVTSQGPDLNSQVDPRFGRAKSFLVVDTETGEFSVHDNTQNLNAAQGAGIQAGRTVVDLGVSAVVTGNVGPKAFATLQACPRTRIAARTTGAGRASTAVGSTRVSGERGTPRSPTASLNLSVPLVTSAPVSKRR